LKKFAVIAVIAMLVISGCALSALINPIIGTWENTTSVLTTKYDLNSDGTSLRTLTALGVGVVTTGIWSSDSTTLTMTWAGSTEDQVDYYAFNSDNSIMTLTPAGGGLVSEFTRQ